MTWRISHFIFTPLIFIRTTVGGSFSQSPVKSTKSSTLNSDGSPINLPPPIVGGGTHVNLVACREAFMAVLASVCDPHLNTIHAVCRKFSESRGTAPHYGGTSLNPPRPVDRSRLHIFEQFGTDFSHFYPQANTTDHTHSDFFETLPSDAYIPSLGLAGPLFVPLLEPSHPVSGHELDCDDIWAFVLTMVDLSKTDAEALAAKLTEKVRCYGFGPVVLRDDVDELCRGKPSFSFRIWLTGT